MISSRAQAIAMAGLLTLPMVSKALVIDFQNPAIETYTYTVINPESSQAILDVQGFRFAAGGDPATFRMATSPDGNRYVSNDAFSFDSPRNKINTIIIGRIGGGRFDLNSFSLFASNIHEGDWHLNVVASRFDVTGVDGTFDVPLAVFPPTNPSYQTWGIGLHDVDHVILSFAFAPGPSPGIFSDVGGHLYLDNFNLTLVPEPTVLGYMGLGLVCLAAVARSRGRAAKPEA
jgi:hypothetical protein